MPAAFATLFSPTPIDFPALAAAAAAAATPFGVPVAPPLQFVTFGGSLPARRRPRRMRVGASCVEPLETRRFLAADAYSWFEGMEQTYNGVSASLSTQNLELTQAQSSITLTLSNLPGHYAVSVGLATVANSNGFPGDSDILSIEVGGQTGWSVEFAGSTGEAGTATVLHQTETVAITFRAESFESGDDQWIQQISVSLFRYRASISTVDGSATENTPGDKMEFKIVADLDGADVNAIGAGQNVDVDLLAPTGTATEGTDFGNLPRTKQVAAGPDGVVFGTEAIDDPDAEDDDTVVLALAPLVTTKPYDPQPATTQAVVKDDVRVESVEVKQQVGSGQWSASGVAFAADIIIKGEGLDDAEVRQLIKSSANWKHWDGTQMTLAEIRAEVGGDEVAFDTGGEFKTDSGWDWQNLQVTAGTKNGEARHVDIQQINVHYVPVEINGNPYFQVRRASQTRDFKIEIRNEATGQVIKSF